MSVSSALAAARELAAALEPLVPADAHRENVLFDVVEQETRGVSFVAAVDAVANANVSALRLRGADDAECLSERMTVLNVGRAEAWDRGLAEFDAARGRLVSRLAGLRELTRTAWGVSGDGCGCASPAPLLAP